MTAAKPVTVTQQVKGACGGDTPTCTECPALCIDSSAGLHPFQAPELPADLGHGYPEAYTPKDEEAPVGVEPVAAAVAKVCLCYQTMSEHLHHQGFVTMLQAGLQDQCDVCTFRNNLNKIFATPLDLKSSWMVGLTSGVLIL